MDLETPIPLASKNYKIYARRLEKLGITKLKDFLFHFPFRYENYSIVSRIENAQVGEIVTLKGKVEKIENVYTKRGRIIQKAIVSDGTGNINIIWFNQPFLTKVIRQGDNLSVSGKIIQDRGGLSMQSPDYEVIFNNTALHTGRLVPVYPETKGISSKWLRRQIFNLLKQKNQIKDVLPSEILKQNNLIKLNDALEKIHFPNSLEDVQRAKQRLAFDELFEIQLAALVRKKQWERKKVIPMKIDRERINTFIKSFPFELTNSQKDAVDKILTDLSSSIPMNRLLEGDVGSGKTIVSAIGMFVSFLNGFQSALMAPTEILANQHFNTLTKLLSPFGVKVEILTSSNKKPKKNFDVIVGTHSLIYKKAKFNNLKFVVIDEQQRFGVEQRAALRLKGINPHILTMTATPIPRTVALTLYGDLELSILSDMPKGRQLVKTWLVPSAKRNSAYEWIEKKVNTGDQVFIICPFIEESDTMQTVKAATKEFEKLKKQIFPNLKLGLLHGRLKPEEKNRILEEFKKGKIDILVSTPVVEVGIDIPNATIMMIEEAERFGLSQLHQLRGRVGRGNKKSYCLLFTTSTNPKTIKRLRLLEHIYSGAQLAEMDLKLRGPGQIYGVKQHGILDLKISSFSDFDLIEKTKNQANKIFPKINKYPDLYEKIKTINAKNTVLD
jgi:ATP-dependent DNA helicase RecG